MAPDVINLISSSPSSEVRYPPSTNFHGANPSVSVTADKLARPREVSEKTVTSSGPGYQNNVNTVEEGLFLSDDFDSTVDLSEPIIVETTGNKRQRLSSPPTNVQLEHAETVPTSFQPTYLGVPASTSLRRPVVANDPIELTSSPDDALPSPLPITTRQKGPRVEETGHDKPRSLARDVPEHLQIDSDPFTSSPRQEPQYSKKPSLTRPDESSDPFASSPVPIVTQARDGPAVHEAKVSGTFQGGSRPTGLRKTRDWDPISSSAPEACSFGSSPPNPRQTARPVVIDIEDSDKPEDSDEELPDITDVDISTLHRRVSSRLQRSQSDIVTSRSRQTSSRSTSKRTAEEKVRDKETKAAAKEVEREEKRREKQLAKEAKAREKDRAAALAEVNKLRTDKKVSTREMIANIPASLDPTTKTQVEEMLRGIDVQHNAWDSPVKNVITWRRKVTSEYNEDIGLWEPIPLRIQDEKHALVLMNADEFVQLSLADGLGDHVASVRRHWPSHQILYLLQGLTPWMRKNKNLRNRQFASRVRGQDSTSQAPSRRRKDKLPEEYIPEETIEDALLELQVMHNVLVHHTMVPLETAEWVTIFTQHVSTIPYKKQRDQATLGAGFCMESGQVKTGENAKDTYVRMLQEIMRVTAPIAYGIANEFDGVSALVEGLEKGGPTRLEKVNKSANKDGAFSDRTVGQAVSRRIHKVFTGRDESSTDV